MNLRITDLRFGLLAALAGVVLIATTAIRTPAATTQIPPEVAAQVKAIDTDCAAIQSAIQALKPIHFVAATSKWKVESDQDATVAERTHASITIADVWKQGKSYAWVHTHSYDQKGNQSATQMCFRQSDGSLERARQAASVETLNGADAAIGYFTTAGKTIYKSVLFEENDPKLAKKISDLPFYKELP